MQINGFYIGQVAVCVDDRSHPMADDIGEYPMEGGVYTIRSFSVGKNELGLRLAEIINPIFDFEDGGLDEVVFLSYRFRPAKETSLAVFDAALKGLPLSLEEV
jgi:hypothetical protein